MEPVQGDCWYFAYGSNLFPKRKEERTETKIRQARRCRLVGYRLAFNKRGSDGNVKANIVPDPQGEVWGVIYLCSPEAMEKLDGHEGAPSHYRRVPVEVITDQGEKVQAVTYQATEAWQCEEGFPQREYAQLIVEGAQYHGLPADYIRQVRRLAGWEMD